MKLQITLDIDERELKAISGMARGYLREDPRKRWTMKEYKESARMAIEQMIAIRLDICSNKEDK